MRSRPLVGLPIAGWRFGRNAAAERGLPAGDPYPMWLVPLGVGFGLWFVSQVVRRAAPEGVPARCRDIGNAPADYARVALIGGALLAPVAVAGGAAVEIATDIVGPTGDRGFFETVGIGALAAPILIIGTLVSILYVLGLLVRWLLGI